MFKQLIRAVVKQNRWYDDLEQQDLWLRFLLFITPFTLAFAVDLWLTIFGLFDYAYTFWLIVLIMAVWRFVGFRFR